MGAGNSNSNSSSCFCEGMNNTEIANNKKKYIEAYGSFRNKVILFKTHNDFKIDVFLINLNTINKFMEIVENSNVLNDLSNKNMENPDS